MLIATIIGFIANVIIALVLRQMYWYENGKDTPVRLRGITWIIWLVASLVPILNCIVAVVLIVLIFICYMNYDLWFETNKDHWLFKKY